MLSFKLLATHKSPDSCYLFARKFDHTIPFTICWMAILPIVIVGIVFVSAEEKVSGVDTQLYITGMAN